MNDNTLPAPPTATPLPSRFQIGDVVDVGDGTRIRGSQKITGVLFEESSMKYVFDNGDERVLVDSIDVRALS